jgi:Domain of unknown function (DUF4249)
MKNILKFVASLLLATLFQSCEDVVDVNLNTAAPKLVIDAGIKWQKGTTGNQQMVKLSTTSSYYESQLQAASGAAVTITNSSTTYNFIENAGTGEYVCTNFNPVINQIYTLTVVYQGQTYTSTDKLYETPVIQNIEQSLFPGFGQDNIQVKFFYQDKGSEDNFYLISFKNSSAILPEYGIIDDVFFQGNQMFGLYTSEDLKANDVLFMSLQGVPKRYANYMTKLLNIAGSSGGNPFSTAPATLRGNITNQSNPENFPFGFFYLSEIDTRNYTIQ